MGRTRGVGDNEKLDRAMDKDDDNKPRLDTCSCTNMTSGFLYSSDMATRDAAPPFGLRCHRPPLPLPLPQSHHAVAAPVLSDIHPAPRKNRSVGAISSRQAHPIPFTLPRRRLPALGACYAVRRRHAGVSYRRPLFFVAIVLKLFAQSALRLQLPLHTVKQDQRNEKSQVYQIFDRFVQMDLIYRCIYR
jgi:hypothetical protein